MIDVRLVDETGTPTSISSDAGSKSENENESVGGLKEIRIVPDYVYQLDGMSAFMSECQALHPDEADSGEEEASVEDDKGKEPGIYEDAEDDCGENGAGNPSAEKMDAKIKYDSCVISLLF